MMDIKTIDAENQSLGRIASQAAVFLRGKDNVTFQRNIIPPVKIKIINASKVKLTGKKIDQKLYRHHSGYPGGLKEEKIRKVIERLGHEVLLKRAIQRMLPNNKLRPQMMKRLIITK
ncbi:MAG TPA: 50S ribosomal protein L13 [Candidatus Vogelbacteria bacterium]|nr:50S ribosomal protein L13 [Candidatus Vogelbacteria bacterium]